MKHYPFPRGTKDMPEIMIYRGGPSPEMAAIIHAHTWKEPYVKNRLPGEKLFYRQSYTGPLLPLENSSDYEDLNRVLAQYRTGGL